MNREQAAKLLPIIQAWVDGKEIQYKASGFEWFSSNDHQPALMSFDPSKFQYRIKPEGKERWMVIHKNGQTSLYEEKQLLANASWYIAQIKITYTEGEGLV